MSTKTTAKTDTKQRQRSSKKADRDTGPLQVEQLLMPGMSDDFWLAWAPPAPAVGR